MSSETERLTITMPSAMARKLRALVAEGDYASTSEVVREALRDWSHRRADDEAAEDALREAIRVGLASGPAIPADNVFSELRDRYRMPAKV